LQSQGEGENGKACNTTEGEEELMYYVGGKARRKQISKEAKALLGG
jgi:hypothetical protein